MSNQDNHEPRSSVLKNPRLGLALNLIPIPFALGYAYLGDRGKFAAAIFYRSIAVLVGLIVFAHQVLECAPGPCGSLKQIDYGLVYAVTLPIAGVSLFFSVMGTLRVERRQNIPV